jgi:hypothetical protein
MNLKLALYVAVGVVTGLILVFAMFGRLTWSIFFAAAATAITASIVLSVILHRRPRRLS